MASARKRVLIATITGGLFAAIGLIGAAPASAITITLDYISPTSGSIYGGDLVHVHGSNVGGTPHILFGGNLAALVSIEGYDDITVATPPGEVGPVDVTLVTVNSGSIYHLQGRAPSSLTLTDGFTYFIPPPAPWFQSIGRASASASCPMGWNPSWAEWMNGHTGGFVCNREQFWNISLEDWNYRLLHSAANSR